jgi:phenylacetate-CoA ligase
VADRTLPDGTLVLPVSHDVLATPSHMVQQAIDEMKAFDPHWFYADATHLSFLVRHLRERNELPPPVTAIALTYTLVTGVARRQLREYFGSGIPTAEVVSMTELGWVAIECPAGRMHVNNMKFFPEFLVGSRPARTGERAELVVTSIGDRLSPHLRYRTGDIYTVDIRRCACGSLLPLARHEGRLQTMIRVKKDGELVLISPRDVDDVIGEDPHIDVYQLHQRSNGNLEFRYIPSTGSRINEGSLKERLCVLLGTASPLSIEAVSYIHASRSGKFASCTSALSEEKQHAA